MVSRETRIQIVVGVLATAMLIAVTSLTEPTNSTVYASVLLVYYGMIFGGTHLYFTWRGQDGSVPIDSRRRFLLTLLAVLILGAIGAFGPDTRVGGVSTDALLAWIAVTILLLYWMLEARAGYLANRPS